MLGSVRYEIRIDRPASVVWPLVGAPERLAEWFPGVVSCVMNGDTRIVTTATGLPLPEQILQVDPHLRRFQFRVVAPLFVHHRGTVDVIALDDRSCLVVYSTESDPRTMALVIGGATRAALAELKRQMELEPVGADH